MSFASTVAFSDVPVTLPIKRRLAYTLARSFCSNICSTVTLASMSLDANC